MLKEHAQTAANGALTEGIALGKIEARQADAPPGRPQKAEHFRWGGWSCHFRNRHQPDHLPGLHREVQVLYG